MSDIKPNDVYTTQEAQDFLKISKSTVKRYLKRGIIKANKVGGRYKILGKELLILVSPSLEAKAKKLYHYLKEETKKRIKNW